MKLEPLIAVAALALLASCAPTLVQRPHETGATILNAPVNEGQTGLVKYFLEDDRPKAYALMSEACAGSYRIDSEGPQPELIPVPFPHVWPALAKVWYIHFSCVEKPARTTESTESARPPPPPQPGPSRSPVTPGSAKEKEALNSLPAGPPTPEAAARCGALVGKSHVRTMRPCPAVSEGGEAVAGAAQTYGLNGWTADGRTWIADAQGRLLVVDCDCLEGL
jgi:hypothetical protein